VLAPDSDSIHSQMIPIRRRVDCLAGTLRVVKFQARDVVSVWNLHSSLPKARPGVRRNGDEVRLEGTRYVRPEFEA
jgi:hypothetical protein